MGLYIRAVASFCLLEGEVTTLEFTTLLYCSELSAKSRIMEQCVVSRGTLPVMSFTFCKMGAGTPP